MELFLLRDGEGMVRDVSLVGFSVTPELRAWRDSLKASIDAGTFDTSTLPQEKDGAWVMVRDRT